jgi:hypothetical protein
MNSPASGEYRDRKTALVVFGVLEIVFGAFLGLMVPVTALAALVPRPAGAAAPPPHMLLLAVGFYGVAATVLIWLGVGSILLRRWARALWVCISGVMFMMGLVTIPTLGYVMITDLPRNLAAGGGPALPPAAMLVMQIVMLGVLLVTYIIAPGILWLFYAGRNVKRTCEVRDPAARWTDRCPLPVLALSLLNAFGAATMLALLPFFGVFPLFGVFAQGVTARLLMLAYGAVMLAAAWGVYRLRRGAWWVMLAVALFMVVSGAATLWHADMRELYVGLGFDGPMAARMGEMAQHMKWTGVATSVPWLVWVVYIRRYFPRTPPAAGV